jgi:hypothetical protein
MRVMGDVPPSEPDRRIAKMRLTCNSNHILSAGFVPTCLLFCGTLVYRVWVMSNDELLAAAVTPESSHLSEPCSFLSTGQ